MTRPSYRIESTAHCPAVQALLFAVEVAEVDYSVHVRGDSAFIDQDGGSGPALVVGDERVVGMSGCIERIVADHAAAEIGEWNAVRDHVAMSLGPATRALGIAVAEGRDSSSQRAGLAGSIGRLHELMDAADLWEQPIGPCHVTVAILPILAARGIDLAGRWPKLAALSTRLVTHPAYQRAQIRKRDIESVGLADIDQVLEFWFGEPAASADDVHSKVMRWFIRGRELDDTIRFCFGRTIDRALAGGLNDWAQSPRGRLALIVVLDQMTRHAFRGRPRAFAGDSQALAIAVAALDSGDQHQLVPEMANFLCAPLIHAEDLTLQQRAVDERRRSADDAPAMYRDMVEIALEQAIKHRDWIAEFGRFPHRNQILGRTSTAEEMSFLQTFELIAPPARFRTLAQH